jgi:hypothetical protein
MRQLPASKPAEPTAPLGEGPEEFLRQSFSLMTQHGNTPELVDDIYTIFMHSVGNKTTTTRQNAFKLW